MAQIERNQEATVYIGNLDDRCTESLVWELMLQAGPVVNVHLPKDRVTQTHQGYGFCEFYGEEDADYAIRIMNQIKLYGKPLRINKAASEKKEMDVGATLFIGNLDPDVDEQSLQDTFSQFGPLVQPPNIVRDPDTGKSKGFGFVSFDNFESADTAINLMDKQMLATKQISVSYAYKKEGRGERHGSEAERQLAAQAQKRNIVPQNRMYPGMDPSAPMAPGAAAAAAAAAAGYNMMASMYPPQAGAPMGGYPMAYPYQDQQYGWQ